jgi:hypothetical protein
MPVDAFPCGSRSTTRTRYPFSARAAPRLTAVVDFPTPPFWFAIATILVVADAAAVAGEGFGRAERRAPLAGRGIAEGALGEGLLTAGS